MATPLLILVADDETHVVNVLAVRLQGPGHAVVCARDVFINTDEVLKLSPGKGMA